MPETVPTKFYDWTYTTTYPGHQITDPASPSGSVLSTDEDYEPPPPPVNPDVVDWRTADPANSAHTIPMAELTRQDPILFYAEIPLFEDELHDNGSSALLVRIVSLYLNPIDDSNHAVARNAKMFFHSFSFYAPS